jgi:hypothetical protein
MKKPLCGGFLRNLLVPCKRDFHGTHTAGVLHAAANWKAEFLSIIPQFSIISGERVLQLGFRIWLSQQ